MLNHYESVRNIIVENFKELTEMFNDMLEQFDIKKNNIFTESFYSEDKIIDSFNSKFKFTNASIAFKGVINYNIVKNTSNELLMYIDSSNLNGEKLIIFNIYDPVLYVVNDALYKIVGIGYIINTEITLNLANINTQLKIFPGSIYNSEFSNSTIFQNNTAPTILAEKSNDVVDYNNRSDYYFNDVGFKDNPYFIFKNDVKYVNISKIFNDISFYNEGVTIEFILDGDSTSNFNIDNVIGPNCDGIKSLELINDNTLYTLGLSANIIDSTNNIKTLIFTPENTEDHKFFDFPSKNLQFNNFGNYGTDYEANIVNFPWIDSYEKTVNNYRKIFGNNLFAMSFNNTKLDIYYENSKTASNLDYIIIDDSVTPPVALYKYKSLIFSISNKTLTVKGFNTETNLPLTVPVASVNNLNFSYNENDNNVEEYIITSIAPNVNNAFDVNYTSNSLDIPDTVRSIYSGTFKGENVRNFYCNSKTMNVGANGIINVNNCSFISTNMIGKNNNPLITNQTLIMPGGSFINCIFNTFRFDIVKNIKTVIHMIDCTFTNTFEINTMDYLFALENCNINTTLKINDLGTINCSLSKSTTIDTINIENLNELIQFGQQSIDNCIINNINSIGAEAFIGTTMTNFNFGISTNSSINASAFKNADVKNIKIKLTSNDDKIIIPTDCFVNSTLETITLNNDCEISTNGFKNASNLTKIYIDGNLISKNNILNNNCLYEAGIKNKNGIYIDCNNFNNIFTKNTDLRKYFGDKILKTFINNTFKYIDPDLDYYLINDDYNGIVEYDNNQQNVISLKIVNNNTVSITDISDSITEIGFSKGNCFYNYYLGVLYNLEFNLTRINNKLTTINIIPVFLGNKLINLSSGFSSKLPSLTNISLNYCNIYNDTFADLRQLTSITLENSSVEGKSLITYNETSPYSMKLKFINKANNVHINNIELDPKDLYYGIMIHDVKNITGNEWTLTYYRSVDKGTETSIKDFYGNTGKFNGFDTTSSAQIIYDFSVKPWENITGEYPRPMNFDNKKVRTYDYNKINNILVQLSEITQSSISVNNINSCLELISNIYTDSNINYIINGYDFSRTTHNANSFDGNSLQNTFKIKLPTNTKDIPPDNNYIYTISDVNELYANILNANTNDNNIIIILKTNIPISFGNQKVISKTAITIKIEILMTDMCVIICNAQFETSSIIIELDSFANPPKKIIFYNCSFMNDVNISYNGSNIWSSDIDFYSCIFYKYNGIIGNWWETTGYTVLDNKYNINQKNCYDCIFNNCDMTIYGKTLNIFNSVIYGPFTNKKDLLMHNEPIFNLINSVISNFKNNDYIGFCNHTEIDSVKFTCCNCIFTNNYNDSASINDKRLITMRKQDSNNSNTIISNCCFNNNYSENELINIVGSSTIINNVFNYNTISMLMFGSSLEKFTSTIKNIILQNTQMLNDKYLMIYGANYLEISNIIVQNIGKTPSTITFYHNTTLYNSIIENYTLLDIKNVTQTDNSNINYNPIKIYDTNTWPFILSNALKTNTT